MQNKSNIIEHVDMIRESIRTVPINLDFSFLSNFLGGCFRNSGFSCVVFGESGSVDVICGGFPCQDISVAGDGGGLNGKRSGLWWEMHRVIGEIRPKVVVLENVAALVVRGLREVLGGLAEIGYDAEWTTLSAAQFGAPHLRNRLFIVAYPMRFGALQQQCAL